MLLLLLASVTIPSIPRPSARHLFQLPSLSCEAVTRRPVPSRTWRSAVRTAGPACRRSSDGQRGRCLRVHKCAWQLTLSTIADRARHVNLSGEEAFIGRGTRRVIDPVDKKNARCYDDSRKRIFVHKCEPRSGASVPRKGELWQAATFSSVNCIGPALKSGATLCA